MEMEIIMAQGILHRRQARMLVPLGAMLLVAGCGVTAPEVTPALVTTAQADDATADANRLALGRSLFVDRCGSCHSLPDPHGYDVGTWERYLRKMAPKAKLDAVQAQAVREYVLAARVH
jgi:cytochrome c5